MERAERVGLGIAAAGHLALLVLLSLHVATRPTPPIKLRPPIDVQLVEAIGPEAAAPVTLQEAPQESKAPDKAPPEDAAPAPAPDAVPAPPKPAPPPPPEPAPPPPEPKPIPPKPKPTPFKPAPKPEPAPEAAPKPRPAPKPKPVKEKLEPPAPEKPAKPKPVKPAPAKTAKPAPEPDQSERRRPDRQTAKTAADAATTDKASNAKPSAKASATPAAKPGAGKAPRATGGIESDDFLKGITPEKSPGKAQAPRAQAISALAMNGLAAAIKRQIQPCYELGSLAGTPAMSIVTTLNLRFNKDGTVAGTPTMVEQKGVDDGNRGYAKQIADIGRRAVLRCAPLKLPPELYTGGWEQLNFRFTPGQMQ